MRSRDSLVSVRHESTTVHRSESQKSTLAAFKIANKMNNYVPSYKYLACLILTVDSEMLVSVRVTTSY